VHLASGLGLALRTRRSDVSGAALAAAAAAALAVALHRIPFERTTALRLAVLALPAALLAARPGRPSGRTAAASTIAGLVILGAIKVGQWHAEWFLARGRDEISPRVIAAIERHRERHGVYPPELSALVPEELPEIPQPRIGWLDADEEVFTYTDLGDSFLLEFSGPLWVQCAYSPPYEEEVEEAAGAGEKLEAAWSCERKPPRLW
jgi:hypothetical protein